MSFNYKTYNTNRRKLSIKLKRCTTCHQSKSAKGRLSCIRCLKRDRNRSRKKTIAVRIRTLSHYGKGGRLMCRANGCRITNLFMLTLDHIRDNGGRERKKTGKLGWAFYEWLRKRGYPKGYQTLCANHQTLKEFMRRKKGWL